MAEKKKLQVFVSSTYLDLKAPRQAAVEAILTAGHIPAGMELFTAGDESQLEVIKRWIAESDVFLLILGGRYGSIEPQSGRSYIECEYDYAVALGKPLFACVVHEAAHQERVKTFGLEVTEQDNPGLLRTFRHKVTAKICRFWEDTKDIKLAIHETLSEFTRRDELSGWVRGDEPANAVALAEEVARLAKENTELRQQLAQTRRHEPDKREEQYTVALNWDKKTRLRGFDLSHRDLSNLNFAHADFMNANFSGAQLENSVFHSANLRRANFEAANLLGAALPEADLRGALLRDADLRYADLRGADLRDADLRDARVTWTLYNRGTKWPIGFDYHECSAIEPYARLADADLRDANLRGANLHDADLSNADLSNADLSNADLSNANLSNADLSKADLSGTNLFGATLHRTLLFDTDLSKVNLSDASLSGALYDNTTQWPVAFDYRARGAVTADVTEDVDEVSEIDF